VAYLTVGAMCEDRDQNVPSRISVLISSYLMLYPQPRRLHTPAVAEFSGVVHLKPLTQRIRLQ
jgi:hypothetical protein